jgi:hypothetical protein
VGEEFAAEEDGSARMCAAAVDSQNHFHLPTVPSLADLASRSIRKALPQEDEFYSTIAANSMRGSQCADV